MERTIKFIEKLMEDMSDCGNWGIEGVVKFKEVTVDGETYAELEDESTFKKQDDYYLHQTTGYEADFYYGTIIYPITESQALRISYSC